MSLDNKETLLSTPDAIVPQQNKFALSSFKSSSSIQDWDHDVENIPRLQVIDEHQNFT